MIAVEVCLGLLLYDLVQFIFAVLNELIEKEEKKDNVN